MRFRDEDDFEFGAVEVDRWGMIKPWLIGLLVLIVCIGLAWFIYNQYPNWRDLDSNETTNETITPDTNQTPRLGPNEIEVTFENNYTAIVEKHPEGIYYMSKQQKITGEECFINGQRKACRLLTNRVCEKDICKKEVITETVCSVNQQVVECPPDMIKR